MATREVLLEQAARLAHRNEMEYFG